MEDNNSEAFRYLKGIEIADPCLLVKDESSDEYFESIMRAEAFELECLKVKSRDGNNLVIKIVLGLGGFIFGYLLADWLIGNF
jgi:hypothetical protein